MSKSDGVRMNGRRRQASLLQTIEFLPRGQVLGMWRQLSMARDGVSRESDFSCFSPCVMEPTNL